MGKYQGNKGLEYYKAYPRDFFEGVVGMPGALRGFYRMVLDLIYMHDGLLLNDWGHISGHTGFGVTQCKRMMATLVEGQKIHVWTENPEYFTNKRAVSELKVSRKFQEKQANNISKRWENKGLGSKVVLPDGIPPQDHKTTRHKSPSGLVNPEAQDQLALEPEKPEPPDIIAQAFEIFQGMAKRAKLAVPAKLSDPRKAKLKARLKDCGGLEGWQVACSKVEASSFCTGGTGWYADLDFMLQEKSFTKLMEGSYDDRSHNNKSGNGSGVAGSATPATIADRAARYVDRKEAERRARGDAGTGEL